MEDEHGNVIDGAARARQWRRSRDKARDDGETPASRADAPKSIAASLLVPAEMLDASARPGEEMPLSGDVEANGRGTATTPLGEDAEAPAPHANPFFAKDAAVPSDRARERRRAGRWTLRPLTRSLKLDYGGLISPRSRSVPALRRRLPRVALRPLAFGAAFVVVLAVGLELATQHRGRYAPVFKSAAAAPETAWSDTFGSLLVFNLPRGFDRQLVGRRSENQPVHRARGRTGSHTGGRASGTRVVSVRYSPPVTTRTNTEANAGGATYQPATSSPPVTTSTPATNPEPSATAASDSPSSSQSTSHPTGPAGPGYVIGSNCNPKCR